MSATLHRHGAGLTWTEENLMARSAHAIVVDGQVWLIDPYEDAPALGAAAELGPPASVVQLLDRHDRDCAAIAERLGVPLHRLPAGLDPPLEVVRVLDSPGWHEMALWWEAERTLIVAEALGTSVAFAAGRRVGVHPLLRLTPPRGALSRFAPGRLLVGHGPPLEGAVAVPTVNEALRHSRSDIPRLLASLPGLLRRR